MAYSPGDPYVRLLKRMSWLPAMPIPGAGRATFQPMWAEDVADCVLAALPGGPHAAGADGARYELAGPQTLSAREIVEVVASVVWTPAPDPSGPDARRATAPRARRAADGTDRVRDLG